MQQSGRVIKKTFAPGSKSERGGIILVTEDDRELLLRRQGGNPFYDPSLEELVGKKVVCQGNPHGDYTFLISEANVVSES